MQPPPVPDENSSPIQVFQYCSYYVRQFFLLYVSPVRDWVYAMAILGCAAVFMWIFLHPQDPDQQYKIVNFLAAWFPFAISIIIALIPDLGTRVKKGWVWRLGVITAGFTYSYLLWHQQGLNLDVSRKDQEKVVTDAVTKANQHTDTKIEGVKTNLEGQGTKIRERLNTLESHLDTTISKVKPPPPKFAKLQFSFYTSDESKFPILSQSMRADANGTFNLEFFLKNISGETGAEKADIWMEICVECRYTEVAAGFQRPAESAEQVRHKSLPHLNQGVYLEPWKVSVSVPEKFTEFHIRFQYACQTCAPGKMPPQQLKVWVIPPFRLSLPKPKKKPS